MVSRHFHFSKIIISILICSLLLSCSASTHFGIVTVSEPSKQEEDVHKWFLYYQDQFDATSGKVLQPSEDYPPQAFEGYQKALDDWKIKVSNKNSGYTPYIITAAVIGIYFIIKSSVKISNPLRSLN